MGAEWRMVWIRQIIWETTRLVAKISSQLASCLDYLPGSETNEAFMHDQYNKSCGYCTSGEIMAAPPCIDLAVEGVGECREWAWHGEWYVRTMDVTGIAVIAASLTHYTLPCFEILQSM
jgi:hypothetical protein